MRLLSYFYRQFKTTKSWMDKRINKKKTLICKLFDLDFSEVYSYKQYCKWKYYERNDLQKGRTYKLKRPFTMHYQVSHSVFNELYIYLKGRNYKIFSAPVSKRSVKECEDEKDIFTEFRPSTCLIREFKAVPMRGSLRTSGPVIEILASDNCEAELARYKRTSEQFETGERWAMHPNKKNIIKYIFDVKRRDLNAPGPDGDFQYASKDLTDFVLKLKEIKLR